MSKRLHELANYDGDTDQLPPDFCPIQDTADKDESKSCAECKDFKTHRVLNSLMVSPSIIFPFLLFSRLYPLALFYRSRPFLIHQKRKTLSYDQKISFIT